MKPERINMKFEEEGEERARVLSLRKSEEVRPLSYMRAFKDEELM